MFSKESWREWVRSLFSLSERKGTRHQKYEVDGLVAGTASAESQLYDLKLGKKNHHSPESLTQAVVDGTTALMEVAKEIDPDADLSQLRPNPNG